MTGRIFARRNINGYKSNSEQSSSENGVDGTFIRTDEHRNSRHPQTNSQLFRRMPQAFVLSLSYDIYNTSWYFIVIIYETAIPFLLSQLAHEQLFSCKLPSSCEIHSRVSISCLVIISFVIIIIKLS